MIQRILAQMGYPEPPDTIKPFLSEEDNEPYAVWRITYPDREMVLKEAKAYEPETYNAFFYQDCSYAPRIYGTTKFAGKDYLLMAYIPGETMMSATRQQLILTLDSLIQMQNAHWNSTSTEGYTFQSALESRQNRGKYLDNPLLESVYNLFLEAFQSVTRTLCHDDLLPFNVICNEQNAVFIDWEYGGILPYPVSLARLIAHGREGEDALFRMKEEDKAFAMEYYYDNCIRNHGIDRKTYDKTMKLFLFYEYCEWIYVGNQYGISDKKRYCYYQSKASELARSILEI